MNVQKKVATMYKLAKHLGFWLVTLESNDNAVQFKSLSRKSAVDWLNANEDLNNAVGVAVWRPR